MKILKTIKWESFLKGVMYILIGIVSLVIPDTMVRTLGYVIGVVLIIAGAVSMICYLLRDPYQNYYHNDFVYGLIGIGLGCVVLYKVEIIVSMIPILLGLLVLISGASKLQDVIDMKRLESGNWILMLVLAVLNLAMGFVLILYPFETVMVLFRVLGAGLIFSGLTDSFVTVYFADSLVKYRKMQDAGADFNGKAPAEETAEAKTAEDMVSGTPEGDEEKEENE